MKFLNIGRGRPLGYRAYLNSFPGLIDVLENQSSHSQEDVDSALGYMSGAMTAIQCHGAEYVEPLRSLLTRVAALDVEESVVGPFGIPADLRDWARVLLEGGAMPRIRRD